MSEEIYESVVEKIQNICSAIDGYSFVFGAERMTEVISDPTKLPCIYLEEYRSGQYNTGSYQQMIPYKNTVMDIYFINTVDPLGVTPDRLAYVREEARNVIENTGVRVFMEKFSQASILGNIKNVTDWKFYIPKPRFDETKEVSIMLQINCSESCC